MKTLFSLMQERARSIIYRLMAVVLVGYLFFYMIPTQVLGDPEWNWNYSAVITDGQGNAVSTLQPGASLRMQISFTAETYDESLLGSYKLYIKKGIFKNTAENNRIDFLNASPENASFLVFDPNSLKVGTEVEIGTDTYYEYDIIFNDSEEAKEFYRSDALTSVTIKLLLKLDLNVTEIPEDLVLIDDESVTLNITNPPIIGPEEEDREDASPAIIKSMEQLYRPNGSGGYTLITGDRVVKPGDLVIFKIVVRNYHAVSSAIIERVREIPADGYVPFYNGNAIPAGIRTVLNSAGLDQTSLDGALDWGDFWTQAGSEYIHEYNPRVKLSPGGSMNLYFIAEANTNTSAITSTTPYKNKAMAESPVGNGIGEVNPSTEEIAAMALDIRLPAIYGSNGLVKRTAQGGASERQTIAYANRLIMKDDILWESIVVHNRGTMTVGAYRIYLYMPEHLEFSTREEFRTANDLWIPVSSNAYDFEDIDSIWSNIKVYYRDIDRAIFPGSDACFPAYLRVKGSAQEFMDLEGGFYLGAEVGYLENLDGTLSEGEKVFGAPVYNMNSGDFRDSYSFPDGSPFNDLGDPIDPVTGEVLRRANNPTHITSGQKEKELKIDGQARQPDNSYDETDDEAGFNFLPLGYHSDTPAEGERGKLLTKTRISNPTDAQLREVVYGNGLVELRDYQSITNDGFIISEHSYVLYDIWINKSGELDVTDGVIFEDILPKGLKLFSYKSTVNNVEYDFYGFNIRKYIGDPKVNGSIIYEPVGYYSSADVGSIGNNPDGIPYRTRASYNGGTANSNENYGINIDIRRVAGVDRGLTLTFQEPPVNQYTQSHMQVTDAAYNVKILAVVDTSVLNEISSVDNELFNEAKLVVRDGIIKEKEEEAFMWDFAASSTYATKFVMGVGQAAQTPSDFILIPDENGKGSIDYRIRVRAVINQQQSGGLNGHGPEQLKISDKFDPNKVESVTNLKVTGYRSSRNSNFWAADGELNGKAELSEGDKNVISTLESPDKLVIKNNRLISVNEQYNTDFTVNYKNLVFGEPVKNRAGTLVSTPVPLKITVAKKDADNSSISLSGYEFRAYYYNKAAETIMENRPVNDINRNSNLINTANPSIMFLPEGYQSNSMVSAQWYMVLKETKAPGGYEGGGNEGSSFLIKIAADEAGVLSIASIEKIVNSGDAVLQNWSADGDSGEVTFQIGNKKRPVTPTDPSQPVTPTDPSQPITPTDPSQPVTPTDPSQPVTPTDPSQPVTPTDPSQPVTPTDPSKPVTPTDPLNPVKPTQPLNPGGGGNTVTPKTTKSPSVTTSAPNETIPFTEIKDELPPLVPYPENPSGDLTQVPKTGDVAPVTAYIIAAGASAAIIRSVTYKSNKKDEEEK